MSARYKELLVQLAKEYESLLRQCEELRASQDECPEADQECPEPVPPASDPLPAPTAVGIAEITAADKGDSSDAPCSPRASTCGAASFAFIGDSSGVSEHCVQGGGSGTRESLQTPGHAESQEEAVDAEMPLYPLWLDQDECETLWISTSDSKNSLLESLKAFGLSGPESGWMRCGCLNALVMSPGCRIRQAWDLLTTLVLIYDITMLPAQVFIDESVGVFPIIHVVFTSVWTADMAMNFFTGYYSMGVVESKLSKVAMHYLKGWFAPDLAVVSLDWVIFALDAAGGTIGFLALIRAFKAVRFVRSLRMLRLVRVLKLQSTVNDIGCHFRSDVVLTVFGVARSLGYILIASHYVACGWYFAGGHHRPFTWVQVFDDEDRGDAYKYLTSLHWSITQFTPASAEVQPRNSQERLFAICVILSGMVAFSCFVSSITQAMATLQRQRTEESKQQAQMRRFFIENRVSLEVGTRITKFISAHKITERRRIYESDVVMFGILPDSFRRELRVEMYSPILSAHPLLTRVLQLNDRFLECLCHDAMAELLVKPGHELFVALEQPRFTFYLRSGVGMYSRGLSSPYRRKHKPVTISGERWLCESALWLMWRPRGIVTAKTSMQCVTLDAGRFRELVSKSSVVHMLCGIYAAEYRLYLQSVEDKETHADIGLQDSAVQLVLRSALSSLETSGVAGLGTRQGFQTK